jgi:hypothetical protein
LVEEGGVEQVERRGMGVESAKAGEGTGLEDPAVFILRAIESLWEVLGGTSDV